MKKYLIIIIMVQLLHLYATKLLYGDLSRQTHTVQSSIDGFYRDETEQRHNKLAKKRLKNEIRMMTAQALLGLWQDEMGCYLNHSCDYQWLNAASLSEALWMKRQGYLPKSTLDLMHTEKHYQLQALADDHDLNAMKIMAVYWWQQGDLTRAIQQAIRIRAREKGRHTFTLRLLAYIYQSNQQYLMAATELRQAALLGDHRADQAYHQLLSMADNSDRPSKDRMLKDQVEPLALHYLTTKFNQAPDLIEPDPRPLKEVKFKPQEGIRS